MCPGPIWIILGIALMITLVLLQRAYLAAWNQERKMYLEYQMSLSRSREETRRMQMLAQQGAPVEHHRFYPDPTPPPAPAHEHGAGAA